MEKICFNRNKRRIPWKKRRVDEKGTPLKDISFYSTVANGSVIVSMAIQCCFIKLSFDIKFNKSAQSIIAVCIRNTIFRIETKSLRCNIDIICKISLVI